MGHDGPVMELGVAVHLEVQATFSAVENTYHPLEIDHLQRLSGHGRMPMYRHEVYENAGAGAGGETGLQDVGVGEIAAS